MTTRDHSPPKWRVAMVAKSVNEVHEINVCAATGLDGPTASSAVLQITLYKSCSEFGHL